jgi:hypothetical protein
MVESAISGLRLALSEMNEGVRALLGPDRDAPELVSELLAHEGEAPLGPRPRRNQRAARRHLALVK